MQKDIYVVLDLFLDSFLIIILSSLLQIRVHKRAVGEEHVHQYNTNILMSGTL